MTDYGSYEFVFKDIDGRNIGAGLIADKIKYFEDSNLLNENKEKKTGNSDMA